jgi:membrane associated rhomboid family serine protease
MIARITYNSPVILSFTFVCIVVQILSDLTGDFVASAFFTVGSSMSFFNPLDYLRLFSHPIGHGGWAHLFGNFSLILLLGPLIEEKYGSITLLIMMLLTAFCTSILNITLLTTGLRGASGIVFMLILLSSITNMRSGKIPLTFILVVVIYLGQEFANTLKADNISQFAHIIGGVCGSIFGFTYQKLNNKISEKLNE